MNTALPQFVQNERVGSHRRRHEPQIIGRCYANFCHIQDFLADDGLVRPARLCDPGERTEHAAQQRVTPSAAAAEELLIS
jgi:hypothetical protein